MLKTIAIIGAGNGGKAAAADLALKGMRVRLFEFPEYRANLEELLCCPSLTATGAITGQVTLDRVTCDLAQAMAGADALMVCTQGLAHGRVARAIVPHLQPHQLIILNPGATCGALEFDRVFRQAGLKQRPILLETSTLTYGCRAKGATVDVRLRVKRVLYGVFPGKMAHRVGPRLQRLYPNLVPAASVLEAGLNNGNPVIHPAIALLNAARIEREGPQMLFYKDGMSPSVAGLIRHLDEERMALLRALGYPAQSEPTTCVAQGYAESEDYLECYGRGSGFIGFASPDTLDHRYFHEDIGIGLVMFCSLGRLLGVPTPACEAVVRIGSILSGVDYFAQKARTLSSLGLGHLGVEDLKKYLDTGIIASHPIV